MASIKPLADRVVVKRAKAPQSKGGVLLPDSAQQEKSREGSVIAVGTGKVNENGKVQPLTVKVGDWVLFGSYSGTEVEQNEEKYLILSEEDIFGTLLNHTA